MPTHLYVLELIFLVGCLVIFAFPLHLLYWIYRYVRWNPLLSASKPSKRRLIIHCLLAGALFILFIPNFFRWEVKAQQSEAKSNLGAIYIAQRAYFSRANTYAGGEKAFKLINWEPLGYNSYAYYCDVAAIPNKRPLGRVKDSSGFFGTTALVKGQNTPLLNQNWPVEMKPKSSQIGFTCMAIGNIDADEDLDVWSINDVKMLVNVQSDI
jgi:type IV pilus assembly protein PilA